MKRNIKIFRASEGNINGIINEIGVAELPVFVTEIETKVCNVFGNGCPTPYLDRATKQVHYVHLEGRDYVVNLEAKEPMVVIFTEPAAGGPLFTIPDDEDDAPEGEQLTVVDGKGKHIRIDQIGWDKDSVEYRTKGHSHCKLTRMENGWWGFIYLNRPALKPVFIRDTPAKTVRAAMEKHTVIVVR